MLALEGHDWPVRLAAYFRAEPENCEQKSDLSRIYQQMTWAGSRMVLAYHGFTPVREVSTEGFAVGR